MGPDLNATAYDGGSCCKCLYGVCQEWRSGSSATGPAADGCESVRVNLIGSQSDAHGVSAVGVVHYDSLDAIRRREVRRYGKRRNYIQHWPGGSFVPQGELWRKYINRGLLEKNGEAACGMDPSSGDNDSLSDSHRGVRASAQAEIRLGYFGGLRFCGHGWYLTLKVHFEAGCWVPFGTAFNTKMVCC